MAMMDKAANIAIPETKSGFAQKKPPASNESPEGARVPVPRPLRAASLIETLYGKYRDDLLDIANKHLPTLWYSSLGRVQASHRICMNTIGKLLADNGDLHGVSGDIRPEEISEALLIKALCEIVEGKFYLQGKRVEIAQIQRGLSALIGAKFQSDASLCEIQKLICIIGQRLRMQHNLGFKDLENADTFDPFIPEAILFWRNHWNDQDWDNFESGSMDLVKLKTIFQTLVHINDFEGASIKTFFHAVTILAHHKTV